MAKLELDCCKDINITVNSPVSLDSRTISLYNSLNESGYNFFDSNDPYYNDICSIYTTQNGTDIALFDRQKELIDFNNNVSMCQSGCTLDSYNATVQKSKCNCKVQNNSTKLDFSKFTFDRKEIMTTFLVVIKYSNFMVLKCYKKAFDFSSLFMNVGRIIMTIIILLYLILLFIYIIKDRKNIIIFLNLVLMYKSNRKKEKENTSKSINKKNKNIIEIKKNNKNKNLTDSNNSKNKKNKRKKNEPPKKNFKIKNVKSKKGKDKDKNKTENLTKSDINDLSNKKLKNIQINIIPIHNLNYSKTKKNTIKNINKISPKINIYGNNKTTNNKDKKLLNKKNDILFTNLNTQELNTLSYNLALIYDKRTYLQYYFSLLKKKQLILFAFLPSNDYNLMTLKICLFLLSFSLYFTINGFFFSDETMHRIYIDKGACNIIYQLPIIIYSSMISGVIKVILKLLCLSEKNILSIKREKNLKIATKKSKEVINCILIKFIIFFILSTSLLLFFWYFISCFCGVYINTQMILIHDTIFSFILSMVYPFGISLIPGIFRIRSLRSKNKNKECLYSFSGLLSLI